MISNLSIGLLLSQHDEHLLQPWIENHDGIAKDIIVGCDGRFPINAKIADLKSNYNQFILNLDNNFARARNSIISKCTTDFILFIDADELLVPDAEPYIKKLINVMADGEANSASLERYNLFSRRFVDKGNRHPCLMKSFMQYINCSPFVGASPGCHERPYGSIEVQHALPPLIIHLKEEWTGNFRAKGYSDIRQQEALEDLNKKIEKTL